MQTKTNHTILVVDDDETLRDVIVFDFKRQGYDVLVAENGTAAFAIVKQQQIDLVVSDIRMPGGDGLTLLENIRKLNPDIPQVILITGFADITENDCLKRGASKVLSKPFDRKTLIQSVTKALANR